MSVRGTRRKSNRKGQKSPSGVNNLPSSGDGDDDGLARGGLDVDIAGVEAGGRYADALGRKRRIPTSVSKLRLDGRAAHANCAETGGGPAELQAGEAGPGVIQELNNPVDRGIDASSTKRPIDRVQILQATGRHGQVAGRREARPHSKRNCLGAVDGQRRGESVLRGPCRPRRSGLEQQRAARAGAGARAALDGQVRARRVGGAGDNGLNG